MRSGRVLLIVAGAALAMLVAIPIVAFGIVPLFVRSTVQEAPPSAVTQTATPASTATAASPPPAPALLVSGMLRKVDSVHFGAGQVSVLDTGVAKVLRFENVDIAGAPNMYVYLSDRTDGGPGRFTDLGPLKATNGSFNYALPATVDLTAVHSVVVWCRAFAVTVTFATLA